MVAWAVAGVPGGVSDAARAGHERARVGGCDGLCGGKRAPKANRWSGKGMGGVARFTAGSFTSLLNFFLFRINTYL